MRMAKTTFMISPAVAMGTGQHRKHERIQENRTFAGINERGTELEGQRIGSIDNEKHDSEGTTLPDRSLEVDNFGLQDTGVVKRVQRGLRPKGVTGTDCRDDLLGDGPSLGNVLERFLHVLGDELVHETTGDGNHGND